MIEIILSNSSRFPTGTSCGIKTDFWNKPKEMFAMVKLFRHEHVPFDSIKAEILDEEKSKSLLGSAGVGLLGATVLGPAGLVAGALVGGNVKTGIFGLSFELEGELVKLVVKTSNKTEIKYLKEKSFGAIVKAN